MAMQDLPQSIAKELASCNARTRGNAVRLLQSRLPSLTSISENEMKKIWKGLFYCVWHSDKQQQQVGLIERLSSLLCALPPNLSLLYFSCFLITIRREWMGIDSHRLDKFYLLIRRFLRSLFMLLKSHSWKPECCVQFLDLIEGSLLSNDGLRANGVNYHIADVFLDELVAFLPLEKEGMEILLKPFFAVLEKSSETVLVGKIRSAVFEKLLEDGNRFLEQNNGGGEVNEGGKETYGSVAVALGLSGKFLSIASCPNTLQANRKVLFALHEAFVRVEKDFERLGIVTSLPTAEDVAAIRDISLDDVDVEEQSENGFVEDNSGKKKKKKKKSKKAGKMDGELNKKSKNEAEGKKKKKKRREGVPGPVSIENIAPLENETGEVTPITFNETVISNLQKKFETVAAEAGMEIGVSNLFENDLLLVGNQVSKKRKRGKNANAVSSPDIASNGDVHISGIDVGKSCEKSAKRVKFSMKSNLVWKPHSPLPPQSLRLPPSVTPRGSAMKKGIPPGPIREAALVKKVKRKTNPMKKAMKGVKRISSAVKHRNLHSLQN